MRQDLFAANWRKILPVHFLLMTSFLSKDLAAYPFDDANRLSVARAAKAEIIELIKTHNIHQATVLATRFLDHFPSEAEAHYALAVALMLSGNCAVTRRYFDRMQEIYRWTDVPRNLASLKNLCQTGWQFSVKLDIDHTTVSETPNGQFITPQNGSRLDQLCKFYGVPCSQMRLETLTRVKPTRPATQLTIAAEREQALAPQFRHRVALAYVAMVRGAGQFKAGEISTSIMVQRPKRPTHAMFVGARVGTYQRYASQTYDNIRADWLGFEMGTRLILRNHLILNATTTIDRLNSAGSKQDVLGATTSFSGYLTPRQKLTTTIAIKQKRHFHTFASTSSMAREISFDYQTNVPPKYLVTVGLHRGHEKVVEPKPYLAEPYSIQARALKIGFETALKGLPWMRFGAVSHWWRAKSVDVLSTRRSTKVSFYVTANF